MIRELWIHANGMPMLYSVCATSRLTRRARQQKITLWSGKSSGSAGARLVLPVSGGERSSTRRGPGLETSLKSWSWDEYGWRNLAACFDLNADEDSSAGYLRRHLCTVNFTFAFSWLRTWRASASINRLGTSSTW